MFCVAAAALPILVWVEYYKSLQPSFALSFYLSITMLLDAARARSLTMRNGPDTAGALTATVAALKFLLVVLLEVPARQTMEMKAKGLTQELTCGFWNGTIMAWVNPLLLTGFRRNLRMDDLKNLDETYSARYLDQWFTKLWEKGILFIILRCE